MISHLAEINLLVTASSRARGGAMLTNNNHENPPDFEDLAGWKEASKNLRLYAETDILKALDTFRGQDRVLQVQLETYLIKRVQRVVSSFIPDRNRDLRLDIEAEFTQAILWPESEMGERIRKYFWTAIAFRTRTLLRRHKPHAPIDNIENLPSPDNLIENVDCVIVFGKAIEEYARGDTRKTAVIRGRWQGKTSKEIEEETGVGERSQRRWLMDFKKCLQEKGIIPNGGSKAQ